MKNTKEVQPILTAIFVINRTNGHEDKDISLLSIMRSAGCSARIQIYCSSPASARQKDRSCPKSCGY